ncbi:hypothetical protein [Peribacillus sp. NPDC060253]|uniref:hypothetical protein n=2 Tax=unclassified Peribacillus TaxID=2675266 RepID=UPI003664740F
MQILSWMAEEDRDRIRKRQQEGIDVAGQNGTVFGRPKVMIVMITEDYKEAYAHWKSKEIIVIE